MGKRLVIVVVACSACSPSSPSDGGNDPGPGTPPTAQCRLYTVGLLARHTFTGARRSEWVTSSSWLPYNTTGNELSGTHTSLRPTDPGLSCQIEIRTAVQYASVADFIDELAAVPPVPRAMRSTSTVSTRLIGPPGTDPNAACGPPSTTAGFSYDGQRRVTRIVENRSPGGTTTFTYTAWDASRRPTAGTEAEPSGTSSLTITYNDTARTRTVRKDGSLGQTVTTETYDANGTVLESVTTSGSQSETYSASVLNAISVCR